MSIKTNQAILKCFIDLKSSVFQKQQTQLTRRLFSPVFRGGRYDAERRMSRHALDRK